MTTIKSIGFNGECVTVENEESLLYRAGMYFGRMYEVTGNLKYDTIGYWCFRAAQVDIWTVIMYLGFILDIVSIVALIALNAANGYDMMDTIRTFFQTLIGRLTHTQTVLQRGPETAGYLYVIGLF